MGSASTCDLPVKRSSMSSHSPQLQMFITPSWEPMTTFFPFCQWSIDRALTGPAPAAVVTPRKHAHTHTHTHTFITWMDKNSSSSCSDTEIVLPFRRLMTLNRPSPLQPVHAQATKDSAQRRPRRTPCYAVNLAAHTLVKPHNCKHSHSRKPTQRPAAFGQTGPQRSRR